ncbi:MAG: hypothetical protein OQK82_04955 [Candidatus Pacearchaeota archaeon]|nr:hypothetical protein [Candidatus Pacearchaeota archaeon]
MKTTDFSCLEGEDSGSRRWHSMPCKRFVSGVSITVSTMPLSPG